MRTIHQRLKTIIVKPGKQSILGIYIFDLSKTRALSDTESLPLNWQANVAKSISVKREFIFKRRKLGTQKKHIEKKCDVNRKTCKGRSYKKDGE